MADSTNQLKSWEDFSAAMKDHLKQFDEIMREHVLMALFHRADMRGWLENLRSKERSRMEREIPSIRRRRKLSRQMRIQINKAIESLRLARFFDDGTVFQRNSIAQAQFLLEEAFSELQVLEDSLAAAIHPEFRNKRERQVKTHSPQAEEWTQFPGFGSAKVDQLFFQWMEDYLGNLITVKGRRLSSAKIDQLISATLDAAFGHNYPADSIKVARRRMRKKRH